MLLKAIKKLKRKILFAHFLIFLSFLFSVLLLLFLVLTSTFLIFEGCYSLIFIFFTFSFILSLYFFFKKKNFFPFFKDYSPERIAKILDENFENLNRELTPAFSFLKNYEKYKKEYYSPFLIDWAIKRGEEKFKKNALFIKKNLLKKLGIEKKLKENFVLFFIVLMIFLLYFFIFPVPFKIGFYSFFIPKKLPIQLEVEPKNLLVKKGEAVNIKVAVFSPFKFKKITFIQEEKNGQKKFSLKLENQSAQITLLPKEEFRYYFQILRIKSPVYQIAFLERKRLAMLKIKVILPAYTSLLPLEYSFPQEISAMPASQIILKTNPFFKELKTEKRIIATERDSAAFLLTKEENYLLLIFEEETTNIKINFLTDEYPYITFLFPNKDIDLPENMKVPLRLYLLDDFQVKEARIYGIKENDTFLVKKFPINKKSDTINFLWDLSGLNLLPGKEIFYYAVSYDNDIINGPKATATNVYKIRFPTLEEIFTKTTERIEDVYSEVKSQKTDVEELLKTMSRIEKSFKEEKELTYEEKKTLSNLFEKNRQLIEKIGELKREVENFLKELEEYPLFDQATISKLMELFRILDELIPQELKARLLQLKAEWESNKDLKKTLSQLKLSNEELKMMIERGEKLLKSLLNISKLKEWEKKFSELERLQKEVEENLEKLPIAEEEKIKTALEKLVAEINEYQFEEQDYQEFQKELKELISQRTLKENAEKIVNEIKRKNLSSAKKISSSLRGDLKNLSERLREFQKSIAEKNKERIFNKLLQIGLSLNDLSKESKGLLNLAIVNEEAEKNFGEKIGLLNSALKLLADSLLALSNQSLIISPKLAQGLIRGIKELEGANKFIAEKNFNQVKNILSQVKLKVDHTVLNIIYLLNQKSKGGGGLEDFLNALQQASDQMGEMFSELGSLPLPLPLNSGNLEKLSEMVNKLRSLREMLTEALKNLSSEPGLTSSMEGILEDMKKLEEDLSKLNIQRELIERTAGIYRRLLDVERSIRKKEEKEEYQAEVGKEYEIKEKTFLPKDYGEKRKYFQEELLKILRKDFPPEYYHLIKEYFYQLLQE